ncbi:poly(A) RNA polymerase GLD2 isoform X2 [Bombina bombina]|uniref:poly(A) RNA polymerase GLD2 isoform X2 n=1 Tax=Bombina bombina TaxID=8345 RepID=UPI00235B1ACF|nr:poly(A) RNA polymerase GLD2 isoform X2 [Bombina bombina]
MFPNSPSQGRTSLPLPQAGSLYSKLPLGFVPDALNPEQLLHAHINFQKNAKVLMSGNLLTMPPVAPPQWSYGNRTPVINPGSSSSPFQNRKRRSDEGNVPYDIKRQRFQSPPQTPTITHQAVPLRDNLRYSFPGSGALPLLQTPPSPEVNGCTPPLSDNWILEQEENTLPVAKDKLSKQILELFQACQQQVSDLKKKDLCRGELQREIQQIFPRKLFLFNCYNIMLCTILSTLTTLFSCFLDSRLYLVGSSLNGFGARSSDADLCLIIKEEPMNQKTEAMHILGLLQKHFYTRLSYIERPQLIRAKVPIVKFRDKVSGVEFDLNVNNVVGIRNTFLLRTYAHLECRVRPLVLVVKKWASHYGINDASRGTLSSYSLVLMVLHYLQTLPEPILPSLQKNYPECFNPTMQLHLVHHAPRNVPPYVSKNTSSLGDLLVGFLKYFAIEFDWNKKLISVREAKAMPRTEGIEWRNKYICVEEPFDRTNTARAVHEKHKFDLIQEEFLKAWVRLRDNRDLNSVLNVRGIISMHKR